ncbi:hypothetical protein [Nannocystis sp. SCPEA4]|uniref:hypothetical protein n=1 Tax=Nannocystis sp. SCPEA4 TaxID=2996787 RepID=UPI00226F6DDB|nr:hypothetical protein [Nannocystis sp. SCPEA4]MCY1061723.1 hypothetical protein [Nannocystis sp. SCPEA4]
MPQTFFSCQNCSSNVASGNSAARQGSLGPTLELTFAHVRQALIASAQVQMVDAAQPLAAWRPGGDLGSVLLESWAYVGDVIRLYNGAIISESYLAGARQRRSLRRLGALLGYQPRPAVGSRTEIAAFVGSEARTLNPASYQGSLGPGAPLQVFETTTSTVVRAARDEYVVAPVRADTAESGSSDVFFVDLSTAAPVRGRPVMFVWFDKIIEFRATEIIDVSTLVERDRREYVAMKVAAGPKFGPTVVRENVGLQSPSQRAYVRTEAFKADIPAIGWENDVSDVADDKIDALVSVLPGGYNGFDKKEIVVDAFTDKSQSYIYLDSVYRSIKAGDLVVLQNGAKFRVHRVMVTAEDPQALDVEGDPAPEVPLTKLTINPEIKDDFIEDDELDRLIIHYNMHDIGRLTRVAHTELTQTLVIGKPLDLEGIHDVPSDPPTRFLLEDANGRGILVNAKLDVKPSGAASLTISGPEWDGGLRVPVKAYGNVLDISRGETVQDEVLGSGDASQPYQTFKLAKSPLTYLSKPNTPDGIASTLEIRVDGIRWHERPSFYGAGPNDAVYIVRHDDEQNTHITFGDGVRGMRLPTGRGNVRANYRHGAGAAVPPRGAINQIVKGVPGLLSVRSPIVAGGGADAETSKDIRKRAPASALVLGRCVSLADFAARVAGTAGVRNSRVEYAWDDASQTAGIKVWYIPNSDDGQLTSQIVADLQAMSEPGTVIRAAAAKPWVRFLFINLEIERDRLAADVEAAVRAALLDPEKGPLAVENTAIGAPLSRSLIVGVAKSVPGVLDIPSMYFAFDHDPIPFPDPGLMVPEGQYLDVGDIEAVRLVVGAVHAESRGCRDLVS